MKVDQDLLPFGGGAFGLTKEGSGTLVLSDATEHGQVELHDIPHVEQVQLKVSDLLFGDGADGGSYQGARRVDDGT